MSPAKPAKAETRELQIERFYGSVSLVEWLTAIDGEQYLVLTGEVSVLEAAKVVGFAIKHDPTANWIARIDGPTQSYNIPGCKVRGIIAHDKSAKVGGSQRVLVIP